MIKTLCANFRKQNHPNNTLLLTWAAFLSHFRPILHDLSWVIKKSCVWVVTHRIIRILLKKLPHSSATDHAGWRYEHIMWAASLDAGRSRPPDALDSLDACDSFVAGRGALSIMALVRFAFNGGIPPACRPWFLGGRLIALRKDGDSPSLRKIRPIAIGSVLGRVVSKCAAAALP